ncbi:MAG: DUF4270 domain-containing protein [Bacteroidales bacterium]|jgi:hypothetical protein|nr:DUF4270 domain-containing protein [Bacteroidales bacterium]
MFKKWKYILIILPFVFSSCVDENEELGLELVNQDELHFIRYDGLQMHEVFFHEDSLQTSGEDTYVVGEYRDNTFGKISSVLYSQISLPASKDFTTINIDSVVLCLDFTGTFTRDTSLKIMEMEVEVAELYGDIKDTAYAFDSVEIIRNIPLFDTNTIFNPDTIMILANGDTVTKQLRLRLCDDFKQRLNQQSFATNADFQQWFKGFRIKASAVSDPNGMLAQFKLTNTTCGMFVYYTDDNDKVNKYIFVIDKNSKRFAQITYDFSGSDISNITTDTLQSTSYNNSMYVGGLGISMARISIDSLYQWYHLDTINNSAINKATLILPVADNNFSNNFPSMFYCAYDTAGVLKYVNDLAYYSSYFDGHYDKSTNAYRLNITQHLFKCMQGGHTSNNLYIYVPSRLFTPQRVILGKPHIEITYSKH